MTTNPPPRRRSPRTFVRTALLLCVAAGVLAAVPVATASAAPIDDRRAEVQRLEGEMNTVGAQLGALY